MRLSGCANDATTRRMAEGTMADDFSRDSEFSGTKAVEDRHRFDEIQLDAWMRQHVEGYVGPLTVQQFKGGQSNPTYRLDTPGRSYVMRRKPFGKLLPSAHAVDREFHVISALGQLGFPVAHAYALCTDDSVIGASFYIMSMEEGRVFWDPTLPSQPPEMRRKIFTGRSSRWRSCTCTIPKRSALAISASLAIIPRARSIVGRNSIARPRRSIFGKSRS